MSARRGVRRVLRGVGAVALLLLAVFLVGRAIAEIVLVHPGDPADYRDDWGGPSYLGVLAVHVGPGLLAIAAAVLWWRRRVSRRHDTRGSAEGP